LLAGLALRLTIAYVLFPSSGFESDIASYASWAGTMGAFGPGDFYDAATFADYPPAYLYVLWALGLLGGSATLGLETAELVKLPPIIVDVLVAYVIYRLVLGWTWPGRRAETLALAGAALFLFNPVAFYDSALWGQTDSVGALVLLLGVAALIRGNSEGAAVLAATAALVKPQFGVVLIPLVAFVLVKRHLLRPGSGPQHRPWAPPALARWLHGQQGWPRLLTSLTAALVTFYVISLPFGFGVGYDPAESPLFAPIAERLAPLLAPLAVLPSQLAIPFTAILEYLDLMFGTAGGYGYLTVNAYNLWALVGSGSTPALAEALSWSDDTIGFLGPVPGVAIGAALLVAGFLWGSVRAAVRDDRWTLLVAATFLAIAFFILPTRVHERYIYPAVALLPLLAVMERRWLVALVLLSVGALINLHGILTLPLYGTENVSSLPLGQAFRETPFIILSALLQTGVGLWVAWQLRPGLRTSPDAFELEAAGDPSRASSVGTVALAPPEAPVAAGAAAARPASTAAREDTVAEEWIRGPGALDWIIARVSRVPIRRDRSAELQREGGGRFDRQDLLVVILLVLFTLTMRGFRLDEPVGMYFDEVYHARTATEFLQDWEYGQPHDIYEFTHPHLAKYAMAWGIRLFGGNEVTGSSELGVPVADAAIEPRWAPPDRADERNGDRLYIATGETLAIYDLAGRELVAELEVPATALAIDEVEHILYLADPFGVISWLDTEALDRQRRGEPGFVDPQLFVSGPGAPVEQLVVTDSSLVTIGRGSIDTFDLASGDRLSSRVVVGSTDAVALPWAERLVVDPGQLPDRAAAAELLADALADDVERLDRLLAAGGPVVVSAWLTDDELDAIDAGIEDGSLAGATTASGPVLAVAGPTGVDLLDAMTLDVLEELPSPEPVAALALIERGLSEPVLYAASGADLDTVELGDEGPGFVRSLAMPGPISDLAWNEPGMLMHALGEAPDGGPTVYVVEPRGRSVFIDVPLAAEPRRLLADTQPQWPADDRLELLAISADGGVANVGIGQNGFGWRFPGVLLSALAAALLYLLARVLFARRSVGLIAAVLIVAEGMLFANARIGMNDVYVTTFILLAGLLFAPLYLAPRRPWTAVAILLGTGIALGIALASKWVALYAIGGLGLLVLFRSGLGRAAALLGMIGITAVLGALAIRPAPGLEDPNRNWAFLLLMLVLTGLLAAAMVRRPIPWTRTEVGLVVVGPIAAGLAVALLGRPLIGGLATLLGVAAGIVAWVLTARGHGPFVQPPPEDRGTAGWLRPGWLLGVPWLFTLGALLVIPIGVYIVSYSPWVELGNQWGLPFIGQLPFLAAGGNDGRTLFDLTESMYRYHDGLRAEHAASSPWWAWPLDLKPVWFFQERYAGPATGLIYDTGNLVVFWLGIAGMGFSAWAAWTRRSLSLTIVVVLWAALWLPWARIDRAAFQYHVYASLPFMLLALSYFLAELWHGPSARVWFLARVAGALAIVAIPLMWLARAPLCILAGTAVTNPDGVACASEVTRTAELSQAGLVALSLVTVGAGTAAFLGWRASRYAARPGASTGAQVAWLVSLLLVASITLGGVIAAFLLLDAGTPTQVPINSDVMALLGLALLAVPAYLVLRARDARRFVVGVLVAALLWWLLWYPNISGLPLPGDLAHIYQTVLLPTWNWDFQFAVNTDVPGDGGLVDTATLVIGAISVVFVVAVGVAARSWGQRRTEHEPDAEAGPATSGAST
jgi:hypothetical protein